MAQTPTLLLTRPIAASERFAAQVAAALGPLHILISPLLKIEFLNIAAPQKPGIVVFTSRNGVEAWKRAKLSVEYSCYCVGQSTADAAHEIGFSPKISGGTVAHLLSDILKVHPKDAITHVHGRHTRGDLIGALKRQGFMAKGLLAYEQRLLSLNKEAQQLLQGGASVIVPLFSPRSAAQFVKAGPFSNQIDIIAISQAAAEACPTARVAPSPDANGMIAAISQGL